jgi:cell division septal protein FtsQ
MFSKDKQLFIVILVLLLFFWLISKLDYWTIESLVIENNNFFITEERIKKRISTSNYVDNIFYYPTEKIKNILKNEIYQLEDVRIKKNIFSKKITFIVKEKKPFINIIFYPNYYIISDEGTILNLDEDGSFFDVKENLKLPLLTGINEDFLLDKLFLPEEYVVFLKKALEIFMHFFSDDNLRIDIADDKNISIMTSDLFEIKIGDLNKIDYKMNAFKILYSNINKRKDEIVYIDVRYPDYPVVKFLGD